MEKSAQSRLGAVRPPASRKVEDPLYRQVSAKLDGLVAESPGGSLFPSERDLSEAFSINRRTLRKALQPFVDKGVLERTTKGTFVRKDDEGDWAAVHLFNMYSLTPPKSPRTLKICMYQNYPLQKRAWERIARAFNRANAEGVQVEIDWLDKAVSSLGGFHEYLGQSGPDVVLLSHGPWSNRVIVDFADAMPSDIAGKVFSDDFLTNSMAPAMRAEAPGFVPVMVSPPCNLWSRTAAGELGIEAEMDALKSGGSPIDVFKKVGGPLAGSPLKVSGHMGDLLWDIGVRNCGEEEVRNFLRRNFEAAARLPENAGTWFSNPVTTCYYVFDSMELLRRRKTLFSGGLLMYASSLVASGGKEFDAALPEVAEDEKMISDISGFIVNAAAGNKEAAWAFVRFMVSEEAQAMMVAETQCLAMLRACNQALPFSARRDGKRVKAFLDRLVSGGETYFKLGLELGEARKNFFPALIGKTMSVEEALTAAMINNKRDF